MDKRIDALMQSRRDCRRLDELSEQTEQALALPPDVIDPDAAEIPNVKPGLAEGHEPGGVAAEYVEEADGATGDLPEGIERRSPPDLGTMPVWNLAELAHPQKPIPQTPTGIGGP